MREGEGMGGAHGNELVGVGRCNWPAEAQMYSRSKTNRYHIKDITK